MDANEVARRRTRTVGAVLLPAAVLVLGLLASSYLDPAEMATRVASARDWIELHPGAAGFLFAVAYVIVTGLSLPGATALSLIGGGLFGLWAGTLLVSFASTIGATISMVVARFFLRDLVKRRFPEAVARIDRGVALDGARYLFALRLVPAFPFFLVNIAMGLTRMPVITFAWVKPTWRAPRDRPLCQRGRAARHHRKRRRYIEPTHHSRIRRARGAAGRR